MRYKEISPHPLLRQYIKCYWLLENAYPAGTIEEVLPQSCYELLYQRSEPYRLHDKVLPKFSMIGALDRPLHLYAGDTKLWCVRFLPWGLPPFGNAMHLARNHVTDASTILQDDILSNLMAKLPNASNTTFTRVLDEVLLSALLAWRFNDSTVQQIAGRIKAKQGSIKVSELAEACFKSIRQTERHIMHATGTQPSDMLGKLRFEQAWKTLLRDPDTSLLQLAAACGYADQAHMTREFKRLAHTTPGQLAKQIRSMELNTNPNVVFVQS